MVSDEQALNIINNADDRSLRQMLIMIRDNKPLSHDERLNAKMAVHVEKLAIARGIARPVAFA